MRALLAGERGARERFAPVARHVADDDRRLVRRRAEARRRSRRRPGSLGRAVGHGRRERADQRRHLRQQGGLEQPDAAEQLLLLAREPPVAQEGEPRGAGEQDREGDQAGDQDPERRGTTLTMSRTTRKGCGSFSRGGTAPLSRLAPPCGRSSPFARVAAAPAAAAVAAAPVVTARRAGRAAAAARRRATERRLAAAARRRAAARARAARRPARAALCFLAWPGGAALAAFFTWPGACPPALPAWPAAFLACPGGAPPAAAFLAWPGGVAFAAFFAWPGAAFAAPPLGADFFAWPGGAAFAAFFACPGATFPGCLPAAGYAKRAQRSAALRRAGTRCNRERGGATVTNFLIGQRRIRAMVGATRCAVDRWVPNNLSRVTEAAHTRRLSPTQREGERVMPLELFFDLVFVLAITQCTALMAGHATWTRLAEGVLVLALLWWAWTAYAWLTSVVDPEEGAVRIALIAAMAALLIVALSVPEAFDGRALEFALAYTAVRVGHIALFLLASRDEPGLRRSVLGVAVGTVAGCALLIAGALLDTGPQIALWTLALALDMGEPYFAGAERWRLVPEHFAERHGLIVIVALGESIVALGVGADVGLTAGVMAAAVLGIVLVSELWWVYFDVVSIANVRRLVEGGARPGAERDGA